MASANHDRFHLLRSDYETLIEPHLEDVTMWREEGYSMAQIAEMLGVARTTFSKYLRLHEALYNAWEAARIEVVMKLEEAALREALGYHYLEEQEHLLYDRDGNIYGRKVIKSKKYRAPQSQVLLDALKVHHPKKWAQIETMDTEIHIKLPEELDEYSK